MARINNGAIATPGTTGLEFRIKGTEGFYTPVAGIDCCRVDVPTNMSLQQTGNKCKYWFFTEGRWQQDAVNNIQCRCPGIHICIPHDNLNCSATNESQAWCNGIHHIHDARDLSCRTATIIRVIIGDEKLSGLHAVRQTINDHVGGIQHLPLGISNGDPGILIDSTTLVDDLGISSPCDYRLTSLLNDQDSSILC